MAANVYVPDVVLGTHIIPFAGPNTRNTKTEIWTHAKTMFLGIPDDQHAYAVAFAAYGIHNFGDLLILNVSQINDLHYAPAGGGDEVPFLLLGDCGRIKCLISMYNDFSRMLDANVDIRTVTEDDFDNYRVHFFRPDQPLSCRHVPIRGGGGHGGGGHGGGAPAARAGSTPAEQFCRAIKKDKDHYPEFNDEKQFDNFRRATEAVARTHGTMDVLTPIFQADPTDQAQVDLFRVQQDFMYAVFVDKLKTDKAKSLVRTHETTQDAQQVWRSLLDHQQTSTTGELHREGIMCHLNTHKLDPSSWRGTLASYITHWMNQFREWEALTPQANYIAGEVKRTMLQSAVSSPPTTRRDQDPMPHRSHSRTSYA